MPHHAPQHRRGLRRIRPSCRALAPSLIAAATLATTPAAHAACPPADPTARALIVTVDGLSFTETFINWGDDPPPDDTPYLELAVESLGLPVPPDYVVPFLWPRDAGDTDLIVPQLQNFLREQQACARQAGLPLIVIGHSWGTILTYAALAREAAVDSPIVPALYITSACPAGTALAGRLPRCPTALKVQPAVVSYTNRWLDCLGVQPAPAVFPRAVRWINYWAWGDVFSGPLAALRPDPRSTFIEDVRLDDRTTCHLDWAIPTRYWHLYNSLIPGAVPNEPFRADVAAAIMETIETCPADPDCDNNVDLTDAAALPGCTRGPDISVETPCDPFDRDTDADVDLRDLAAFQRAFMGILPSGCGNNRLDAGEECDGTADAACPGQCRADCTCPLAPANDECADALSITDGDTTFTTVNATTDGPDEPGICTFFGESHIESDVWFCYTATCTGTATATLCGSQYDTKMAVYNGCACPPGGDPIVCSDDDCGVAFTSRAEFTVLTGQQYMIRVGGFQGGQGEGLLTVGCNLQPCTDAGGPCFDPHGGKGCEDEACCNTTCDVDPFCCDVEWDEFCAAEAEGLCTGSFAACAAGAGSCASDNATPGCDDVDCCNQVCMDDPFCCVDTWDELCAEAALATCFLTCGGQSGSCFATEGNGTPGCEDVSCCEAVCAIDPLCCTTEWDGICAETAATECR